MLQIVAEELKTVARNFYNITGVKIVLYDNSRTPIYSYPETMCRFCELIRTNAFLTKRCLECDNLGFDICDSTRKPHIYKCHMNLIEAIAPIMENGVIIGYMMLGQLLSHRDAESAAVNLKTVSNKNNIDCSELLDGFNALKIVNEDFLNSAVSMMSMCACYLYYNRIIENKNDVLPLQIKNYIETHLGEKIGVKRLCDTFYISKTKLYQLSSCTFGMGISEYIRQLRIKKAKQLLLDSSDKSISEISYITGFDDPNYFSRTFRLIEGKTPKEFRKAAENQSI